ncbi:MAG TPA: glutamate--tRNA ligase [Candidatus Saccharimonadales bacterium]|nr:glutamate--tRNA ligase [Candidatus Saccharimonadales bacterium]
MKTPVRVRFAPSPTGLLNLGGVRSALFNWLFARKHNGVFILRFEDTDRQRYVPEAAQQIQDSLRWLGLEWDEGVDVGGNFGPYTQSERLDKYRRYADELLKKGALYRCWCSPERLSDLRHQAQLTKTAFKYDRYCLDHPSDPATPHVLRFQIPDDPGEIKWDDAVKGPVSFKTADIDDFVALKSDGFPTYHLANVIDDHAMGISHVLRADEWLSSTPKHVLLYQAFGWDPPVFAHLPAVLGQDKTKKLSKRHGAKPVLEYRDEGYLPDAVINFLAGLGWNAGDGSTKEIYTRPELIEAFSLERVQTSPAVFDPERLSWLNGVYIRSLSIDALLKQAETFWPEDAKNYDKQYKQSVLTLVQERLKFLAELPELTDFFFSDPTQQPFDQLKQLDPSDTKAYLKASLELVGETSFTHQELEAALRGLADKLKTKPGQLFGVIRVAITGKTAAPGLFETMLVLRRETVLRRLKHALKEL